MTRQSSDTDTDTATELQSVRDRLDGLIALLWIVCEAGRTRGDDADLVDAIAHVARDGEDLAEDLERLAGHLDPCPEAALEEDETDGAGNDRPATMTEVFEWAENLGFDEVVNALTAYACSSNPEYLATAIKAARAEGAEELACAIERVREAYE